MLAWADELREVRTVCFCGKKATMVVRRGADGNPLTHGDQVGIGGEEQYVSLCRRHFRAATSKNDDGKSEAVRFVESALGAPALPPGRALPGNAMSAMGMRSACGSHCGAEKKSRVPE